MSIHPRRTRFAGIAAVLGLATSLVVGVPAPASAAPSPSSPSHSSSPPSKSSDPTASGGVDPKKLVTFGVQPASAVKGGARGLVRADARANLNFLMGTGSVQKDHVAVLNYSTRPLPLNVYATDGINTASGGFSLLAAGQKPRDSGAWVSLGAPSRHVVVPPRSVDAKGRQVIGSVILPVTITVPKNAAPGDHVAGIVASLDTIGTTQTRVRLDQRIGTRVYVRVGGPLRPSLRVDRVHVAYRGTVNPFGTGSATVSYRIRNDGNVKLGATQSVKLSGLLGSDGAAPKPNDLAMLLPGNSVTVTVPVHSVFPPIWLSAKVSVTPVSVGTDADPTLPHVSGSGSTWAVPWTLLALVVVLAASAGGALWLRRRRRSPGPVEGQRAARPRTPAKVGS